MEQADIPDGKREREKRKKKCKQMKKKTEERVFDKMTTIRQCQATHQRDTRKRSV